MLAKADTLSQPGRKPAPTGLPIGSCYEERDQQRREREAAEARVLRPSSSLPPLTFRECSFHVRYEIKVDLTRANAVGTQLDPLA
jgi:hypothetical protein